MPGGATEQRRSWSTQSLHGFGLGFGKVVIDRFAVDGYAFSAAARGLSTRHHQQCGWMGNSRSVCVWVECACTEPSKTATYLPTDIGNCSEPGRVRWVPPRQRAGGI